MSLGCLASLKIPDEHLVDAVEGHRRQAVPGCDRPGGLLGAQRAAGIDGNYRFAGQPLRQLSGLAVTFLGQWPARRPGIQNGFGISRGLPVADQHQPERDGGDVVAIRVGDRHGWLLVEICVLGVGRT
jgi:hypothetical protein